jgi:hypothetical protein
MLAEHLNDFMMSRNEVKPNSEMSLVYKKFTDEAEELAKKHSIPNSEIEELINTFFKVLFIGQEYSYLQATKDLIRIKLDDSLFSQIIKR